LRTTALSQWIIEAVPAQQSRNIESNHALKLGQPAGGDPTDSFGCYR
jgi:hypothetical protein